MNFGHTAYALAAILLPESRAHGRHMQKTLFPWPALRAREACVLGRACMLGALVQCGRTAGVGATPWVPGDCAWHRGWVEAVGRVLLATGRVWEGGVPVDACRAGQRGIFPCVCVCVCVCVSAVRGLACVDAWAGSASGGSFRAVALVTVWDLGLMLHEQACYHS